MIENQTGELSRNTYALLEPDFAEYQAILDDADATEEEKRDFLETLWRIAVTFVDMGFGIDPTQQAMHSILEWASDKEKTAVSSSTALTDAFETVTTNQPAKENQNEEESHAV